MSNQVWTPTLVCPSGGSLYVCLDGSRFIGCCEINPCGTDGCPADQLAATSFRGELYGLIPDQDCAAGVFFSCTGVSPSFWGCCKSNPCANGCPESDLGAAFLSSNPNIASYYEKLNGTSVIAVNTTASNTSASDTATLSTTTTEIATAAPEAEQPSRAAVVGGDEPERLSLMSVGVRSACIIGGFACLTALVLAVALIIRRRKQRTYFSNHNHDALDIATRNGVELVEAERLNRVSTDIRVEQARAHDAKAPLTIDYREEHFKRSTTVWQMLGWQVATTLLVSALVIVGVLCFLTYLWAFLPDNSVWHGIMVRGWVSTAVTTSSLVIRTAVDLQAGIATAMLATLILETGSSLSLLDAARVSKLRAGNAIPLDLVRPLRTILGLAPWKTSINSFYVLTIPLLLATTTLLQFTSTLLVSDLSLGLLPGSVVQRSIAYDLFYNTSSGTYNYKSRRTPTWQWNPSTFPAFAEYAHGIDVPDHVDDTGTLLRTFLPYSDAQSRETLQTYSGEALALDARVTCQPPQLEDLQLQFVKSLQFSGTYRAPTNVTSLQSIFFPFPAKF